jgi:hypothetical protein
VNYKSAYNKSEQTDSFFASAENNGESDVDILVRCHDVSIDSVADRGACAGFLISAIA